MIFCLTCFNIIDYGNAIQNHLNLGYIGNFEDTGKQEDSPLIVELIHSKLKVFSVKDCIAKWCNFELYMSHVNKAVIKDEVNLNLVGGWEKQTKPRVYAIKAINKSKSRCYIH